MFSTPAVFFLHCFWPKKCFCDFRWKLVPYAPSLQKFSTPRSRSQKGDLRQINLEPWDFSTLRITHALCISKRWSGYACNAADYACLTKHQTNSPRGECSWDLCKSCARSVETCHEHEQGGVDVPTMQPAAHATIKIFFIQSHPTKFSRYHPWLPVFVSMELRARYELRQQIRKILIQFWRLYRLNFINVI